MWSLARIKSNTIAAIFTVSVLLVPIILLNIVKTTAIRFTIIFLATGFFIAAVTAVSKATLAEIFVAGATYSAVLVLFVASNGPSGVSVSTGGSTGFFLFFFLFFSLQVLRLYATLWVMTDLIYLT